MLVDQQAAILRTIELRNQSAALRALAADGVAVSHAGVGNVLAVALVDGFGSARVVRRAAPYGATRPRCRVRALALLAYGADSPQASPNTARSCRRRSAREEDTTR